jgi:hypothetical protein
MPFGMSGNSITSDRTRLDLSDGRLPNGPRKAIGAEPESGR